MNCQPYVMALFALGCGILLIACDDPRDKTEGTPDALASYNVASETIAEAKNVLGGASVGLSSARTDAEFNSRSAFLNVDQIDAVMTIQRQLANLVSVIEKEPGTRAAAAADVLVQKNHGFLTGIPRVQESWLNARQRMPQQ
jgi:hypothetical protein